MTEPLETPQPLPPSAPKEKAKGLFGWIVALGIMALKYGFLVLKSLKTSLSMLLMIWVYSWLYGWRFAAGFVGLLFVHEMGHVVAAKWLGLPVSAPLFIPFVGASITMKEHPRDAWTEALMAYGGPLAGALGSWIGWAVALWLDLPWLMAVASASFILNLFNLIPVPPLDGGRICAAVSPWFWFVGLLLLGGAVFYFHSWGAIFIVLLVLFYAVPRVKKTFLERGTPEMVAYYATHPGKRVAMALLYLGLIALLLFGYWDSDMRLGQ
ncbi:Zn-dependent protease (includes SpoIVFB) [Verrucomicrobium sp. GAS474]|uniref:site-2 protease family protein n=1 Tax=Verrucomicrobium sp. GAS474 TaxID=1882831 RepID=UPI00087DCCDC|nr:site-2 protease family protein [Verrucomicrobium sp. GAS474]SDU29929.1 Zn-dependent protease (includes SpoIVFB) [Verrucomicrobium sp. GAS474]